MKSAVKQLTLRRKIDIEIECIKRDGLGRTLKYWWYGFCGACKSFWEHDQCQGHSISIGKLEESSGKLEVPFGVEGHEGSAFISKDFWMEMGKCAGWLDQQVG